MRSRTAGLGIVVIMAAATAGCSGASAINGPANADPSAGQLPRVADDSGLGAVDGPSRPRTSALHEAPDRATTVVPSTPKPGRGNVADDPYLPPRAVIPPDPDLPPAPPPSTSRPSTPPTEGSGATEPTRPTLPTPKRPKPLLPPAVGGPDLPNWEFGATDGEETETDRPETQKPAEPAEPTLTTDSPTPPELAEATIPDEPTGSSERN